MEKEQETIKKFRDKFGQFYISIDSKTKAIRIVDIQNAVKVNGNDGSLIECVASGDIEKYLIEEIKNEAGEKEKQIVEMIRGMEISVGVENGSAIASIVKDAIIRTITNFEIK